MRGWVLTAWSVFLASVSFSSQSRAMFWILLALWSSSSSLKTHTQMEVKGACPWKSHLMRNWMSWSCISIFDLLACILLKVDIWMDVCACVYVLVSVYLSTAGRRAFSLSSISRMSLPHSSSRSLGWRPWGSLIRPNSIHTWTHTHSNTQLVHI